MNSSSQNRTPFRWYPGYSRSLRWLLLSLMAGILLVTLVVIGTSVFYFIWQNEQQTWQGRQAEAARHAGETVTTFMQRMQDILYLVGALEREELIANPQVMPHLLKQNPALLELIRLDEKGQVLASTSQDAPLLANLFTLSQSRWFIESQAGRPYLSEVQISSTSEPYLIISVPALDGGVVAARLRMNVLWDVVAALRFGQTGQAYVVNHQGQIVAHTDPVVALALTTLAERPEMSALLQAPNQEWNGSYANFEGTQVVGVTKPVSGTEWVVITEVTEAEAFEVSRTALLLLSGGLFLFGLLVMLITGHFLGILILQPLEQLRAGTTRVGQGDLTHQIELAHQDEMGQVAQAFNDMVKRLREREAQVVEQTQALQESELRFRQLVTSISDHIYLTEFTATGEHINRFLSPNIETLTGYPCETFMADWNFWPSRVIHPEDRATAAAQAARLAQGQNSEVEYRLVRADGTVIWVRDNGRVEKDPLRQSLSVFGVVSNISQRKQAEFVLAQARDQALTASRLKTELLAKVSHELRTPLGVILGYAELLQEELYGPLPDEQRAPLKHIIESSHYLTKQVNELLDQARLEAGKLELHISNFVLTDIVDQVHVQMQVLAQAKGLTLTTKVAANMPPLLSGDPIRLQQILTNLVSNAIKFTKMGLVYVSIDKPGETHWAMQVSDTGPGIPVEAQAYIFEPFRQMDGSMTREQGGTGLGLSIVKQLVTLMGGEIILGSEMGQGSTFTVLLPLNPIQEAVGY